MSAGQLERLPRRDDVDQLPRAVPGEQGLFTVDATWGVIQPLELPGGIATVGELEVMEHLEAGGILVDTRQPHHVEEGVLPGQVRTVRHQDVVEGLADLAAGDEVLVLYCNGPQCRATPQAVDRLLQAGWNPSRLRYYRGGIHDWVTLGLPLAEPAG